MGYQKHIQAHLMDLEKGFCLRALRETESASSKCISVDGQLKRIFCSNNYLGLADDPRIIHAVTEGLKQYGLGSGGSRLICGHTNAHTEIEDDLAVLLKKESALVFPSGFMANYALLSTLPRKTDLVLIDKYVHASIIDGVRACPAKIRSYPHSHYDRLIRLLEMGGYDQAFIITDSLFSMDGDYADLETLVEIKKRYSAMLILDEAHAFGCVGQDGRGVAASHGVLEEIDIVVGTFSKALGGAGGFIVGQQAVVDYLVNTARAFMYTTGLPAINCIAAKAALKTIHVENDRRKKVLRNGDYFRNVCLQLGLDIGMSQSYIVPIIIGDPGRTMAVAERLWDAGYWVAAVRPPTVRAGSSRLRVSLMSEHDRTDLDGLLDALEKHILQS